MNIAVAAVDSPAEKLEFNRCVVCDKLTSYWPLYCSEHEYQADVDMEPKDEYIEPEELRYER